MIHDYSGVIAIDTKMHGRTGITAAYHLPGPRPALIETGPASSLDATWRGLEEAGVDHLDWIILTHIHLDHAGAVGHMAKRFPEARIVVREEGAPHLVDPSRLWASASRIYPNMEELWGSFLPVDEDQLSIVGEDGVVADLGDGRALQAIYAPGHAQHHMAVLETGRGDLFVGDGIGIYLPEANAMRPATPPPEYNLEVWLQTLDNLRGLDASRVFPTHFGPVPDVGAAFDEAAMRLRQWTDTAREVFAEGGDAGTIAERFRELRPQWYPDIQPDVVDKFEQTTSYDMNAAGIYRYLRKG